jgi:hypothetical protein
MMLDLNKVLPQVESLADFQAKYGVQFNREAYTRQQPNERGEFTLEPSNGDPLPPMGCHVKVYDYEGHTYRMVVIGVNEFDNTYTVATVR